MKKLLLLLLLLPCASYAQKEGADYIDSLFQDLTHTQYDTSRVDLLCEIANSYSRLYAPEGMKYADKGMALAKALKYTNGIAKAYNAAGNAYLSQENTRAALANYRLALKIYEQDGEEGGLAITLGNIGNAFYFQSKYDTALRYYFQALAGFNRSGDTRHKKGILNRIVDCYSSKKEYGKAGWYFITASKVSDGRSAANFYNGALLGILVFIILYNLFLFHSTKEKSIKYLVLLVISFSCTYILTEYFYGNRIKIFIFRTLFLVTLLVNAKSYLKFIYYFLLEYEVSIFNSKHLAQKIRIIDFTFCLAFPLSFVLYFMDIKQDALATNLLIETCTLICFSQLAYPMILFFRNGLYRNKGVRFIALAQAVLLIGVTLGIVLAIFFNIRHGFIEYSGALFFLLLSISVADKINLLKIQKAKAQEEALQLAIANEKVNTRLKEQELKSANHMLDAQEAERKRIASDLHDRLGSMLSTVKLYFGAVDTQLDQMKQYNREQYSKATELLDEAVEEVRKISHDLVSGELIKFGLASALRQMAKTIEDTGRLKVTVLEFGMEERLPGTVEIALYRVLQELMNNILKHSRASAVTIQLNKSEESLNIIVEDNGLGFDVQTAKDKGGMGLSNIETRINSLGGDIIFDTGKGAGTTTIINVPVKRTL